MSKIVAMWKRGKVSQGKTEVRRAITKIDRSRRVGRPQSQVHRSVFGSYSEINDVKILVLKEFLL